jgi:hypothetical protein
MQSLEALVTLTDYLLAKLKYTETTGTLGVLFLNSQQGRIQRPAQWKTSLAFWVFLIPRLQVPTSQILSHDFFSFSVLLF